MVRLCNGIHALCGSYDARAFCPFALVEEWCRNQFIDYADNAR